ncbi:MAG: PadR family transcriptional regulator [Actinobacteria bacterium]|nr:MAG: PadR family transcriptional regulator [Actinomycetota bacterium]
MSEDTRPLTETVYYVLLSLVEQRHGYGIMQYVREMTEGRVVLGAGTLYGALSTLQEKGWIQPLVGDAGERKKEYQVTAKGRSVLALEVGRLERLIRDGNAVLEGGAS